MKLLSFFLCSLLFFSITTLFTIFYTSFYFPSDDSTHGNGNLVTLNSTSTSSPPKTLSVFVRMKKKSWKKTLQPPPPPPPPPAYDYVMLALTWPPGFCKAVPCYQQKIPSPLKFTVHGLWFGYEGAQPHEEGTEDKKSNPPHFSHVGSQLLEELRKKWPNIRAGASIFEFGLWVDQWQKHGHPSGLDQDAYFRLGLKKFDSVDMIEVLKSKGMVPSSSESKNLQPLKRTKIAKELKDHFSFKVQLDCAEFENKLYLKEVRLCYHFTDTEKMKDCPSRWTGSCNKEDIFYIL